MTSSLKNAAGRLSSLPKPSLPDKLKGGRLERIGQYIRNILDDYKVVAIETSQDMKDSPFKSAVIVSLLLGAGYLGKTNPSADDFWDRVLHNANDLLLVGDPIRNPGSDSHMQRLVEGHNQGTIRRFNAGVCSFMWEDRFDKQVDLFDARAKPLKVGWLDMKEKIVDIGIMGRWLYLEKAMIDYDINPNEWPEENKTT